MQRFITIIAVAGLMASLFSGCASTGRFLSNSSGLRLTAYPSQQGAVNQAVQNALNDLDLSQFSGKSVYLESMSDPVYNGIAMYPYIRDCVETALLENGAKIARSEEVVAGGTVIRRRPDNADYEMYILMPQVGVNHRSDGMIMRQTVYETIVELNIKAYGDGQNLSASGSGKSEVVYGQYFLIWSLPGTTEYTETPGMTFFDAYIAAWSQRHETPRELEAKGILQR